MNKFSKILFLIFPIILIMQSCIGNKDYIYLQNKTGNKQIDSGETFKSSSSDYKLKPNDILFIKLVTEDEKLNSIFNPMFNGNTSIQLIQQAGSTGTPFYIMGYGIDQSGNLELPYLGKLNLANKTIEEAKIILENEAKKYFKNFYIQVK